MPRPAMGMAPVSTVEPAGQPMGRQTGRGTGWQTAQGITRPAAAARASAFRTAVQTGRAGLEAPALAPREAVLDLRTMAQDFRTVASTLALRARMDRAPAAVAQPSAAADPLWV